LEHVVEFHLKNSKGLSKKFWFLESFLIITTMKLRFGDPELVKNGRTDSSLVKIP